MFNKAKENSENPQAEKAPQVIVRNGVPPPPPPPPPPSTPRPGFFRFPDVELSGKLFRR